MLSEVSRSLPRTRMRTPLGLAIAALAVGAVSAARGAIPDADRGAHGCYTRNGGALRIIDSARSGCNIREAEVADSAFASRSASRLPSCAPESRRFRTLPDLRPVRFCISRRGGPAPTAVGRLLITPRPGRPNRPAEQYGAMIVSNTGQILWFAPRRDRTHDLKMVSYRGRRHLAVFEHRRGGRDFYDVLDHRYERVARIRAGNGLTINAHELQLTPRGTAYVSAYPRVRVRGVGRVTDFVVQEIDLATGDVLFEWRALDHVPVSASFDPRPSDGSSWDYFHGNSIEPPVRGGGRSWSRRARPQRCTA